MSVYPLSEYLLLLMVPMFVGRSHHWNERWYAASHPSHREPGREEESTRRKVTGNLLEPVATYPSISSPLTVVSPTRGPSRCVNLNTSPARLPSIAPDLNGSVPPPAPINRNCPVTFDPSCCNSSKASKASL